MDNVRPYVQSVTHNLPGPVRDLGVSLIGPKCYDELIVSVNIAPGPCLSLAVSKALGVAIIIASSIVKLPQILKLLSSRSAAGLSLLSLLLETGSYGVSLAYNVRNGFPFSTYGETALIAAQNVAIVCLVLRFGSGWGVGSLGAFVAGLIGVVAALGMEGVVGMRELSVLQAAAGAVGVASKAPQIWTVWREGGTGQLSAFAVFNYLAGSLSRIFTTIQEVDDPLILYAFVAGFALNAVLAAQMVYYWNSPASSASNSTSPTAAKKGAMAQGSSTATSSTKGKGSSTRTRRG
ncbi:MAG: hypothetical protein M4579_000138 [Chaenotheca gracillima]|nr:MAG: hypothetical protein M4579_000138 [Chaenotheca gracillima]